MAKPANVFTTEWDFAHGGVGLSAVAKQAGAELLGATVLERIGRVGSGVDRLGDAHAGGRRIPGT